MARLENDLDMECRLPLGEVLFGRGDSYIYMIHYHI